MYWLYVSKELWPGEYSVLGMVWENILNVNFSSCYKCSSNSLLFKLLALPSQHCCHSCLWNISFMEGLTDQRCAGASSSLLRRVLQVMGKIYERIWQSFSALAVTAEWILG